MTRRHTLEYVKEYFENNGCELLANEYKDTKTKMKYRCICGKVSNIHFGNFSQGKRCMSCGGREQLTTGEFIAKAKMVHKDRYNYSKVEYRNIDTKVIITCKKHGDFFQRPYKHLMGQNCKKCSIEKISKDRAKTRDKFIRQSKEIHKDRYDYSKVEYKNGKTDVTIVCLKHGSFKQKPKIHLIGCGCQKCNKGVKLTTKEFIEKAKTVHNNKYDYSKSTYKVSSLPILISCPTHGDFSQIPNNHLRGEGCIKCSGHNVPTTEEFIEKVNKIHKNKYNYSKTNYIDSTTKVVIICKRHGEFLQSPFSHIQGAGCPHCGRKNEGKVKELLLKYFEDWAIFPHKKIWNSYKNYNHKRYCDFWLEKDDTKLMVEYDGEQHYYPARLNGVTIKKAEDIFLKTQLKDKLDKQFCKENDIILHRIKYNEDKEESIKRLIDKYALEEAR